MADVGSATKPPLPDQPVAAATSQHPVSQDDSTVETAEEAVEPPEADISELCKDMFGKMSCYLTGELVATSEDYKLLENMNKLTCLKYMEMKDIAGNISRNLKDLNKKYASLQPYLEQINQIEEQVASLENAAYKLDAYSKRLDFPCKAADWSTICYFIKHYILDESKSKVASLKENFKTGTTQCSYLNVSHCGFRSKVQETREAMKNIYPAVFAAKA